MALRFWTQDGRYAVFEAGPAIPERGGRPGVFIVDATTLTSFEIDRATQLAFAPDGQHLAALVGRELVIYDLATAKPISKPRPIYDNLGFTPDRRLVWVERDGIELRVHLRDLATGAEQVLVGLPASPLPRYNEQIHEHIELAYDARGHVMASTPEAIRVWENDAPQPVVAITGFVEAPSLTDDGLAYRHQVDGRGVFRHIDLVEHREPVELHHSRSCGTGELAYATHLERCAANRYLVHGLHGLCVWDTQRGELLTSIHVANDDDDGNDYSCRGDVVRFGDRFFSALTGKKIRAPHDFNDRPQPVAIQTGQPIRSDKLPADAIDPRMSPQQTMIAGVLNGRGTLWTPNGRLVWQTPTPSEVQQIALSPNGELAAVGREGKIWHVDLASHALHTARLVDCNIADDTPITTTADGHVVATCITGNSRRLVLEGVDSPLYASGEHGWNPSVSSTASATTVGWVAGGAAHVFSLPDGIEQWSFPVPPYGFSVTNDRRRFAAVEELGLNSRRYLLTIRDATNHAVAIAAMERPPAMTLFSTDDAYLASAEVTGETTTVTIFDTKLGNVVDTFRTSSTALAWDPSGAPRIAAWLPTNLGLAIRDVIKHRDEEIRLAAVDGPVHAMAWSDDALAVLADQRIVIWTTSRSTIALAGTAGIEVHANTTATLLGDSTTSRAMFSCRVGTQSSPTMWCDDKLVDP